MHPSFRIHAPAIVYFVAVWRAGSIRAASRQLNVASSAVNRQILKLEGDIGTPLFDRIPGGLRLTSAGELFARHALQVLQGAEQTYADLAALKGIRRGHVEIGTVEGLCRDFLPPLLATMRSRYANVTLGVSILAVPTLPTAILNGDIHLALAFEVPRSNDLKRLISARFCVGAVLPRGHPLAGRPWVSLKDCAQYPLIIARDNFAMRGQLEVALHGVGATGRYPIEAGSLDLMKQLAVRGVGIAFQTRFGLDAEIAAGNIVHIPLIVEGPIVQELGLYCRASASQSPAADAFARLLAEAVKAREAAEPIPVHP